VKLEQSFEVAAPPDAVWAALIDVQRVAPCLPGAELTAGDDERTYQGTFSVKLGPTSASYRGTLTLEEVDEGARRATMRANGTDKRGQGGAKATIVSTVREGEGGMSLVAVDTDYSITGRLAAFGRGGMIQDVANRLLREFAACLSTTLAGDAPAADAPTSVADAPASAGVATGTAVRTEATAAPAPTSPPAATQSPPAAAASPAAKPVSGVGLVLGVLRDRLARLAGRLRARVRARRPR
jgi:carbon monoxide dehydrogenase subunit G